MWLPLSDPSKNVMRSWQWCLSNDADIWPTQWTHDSEVTTVIACRNVWSSGWLKLL